MLRRIVIDSDFVKIYYPSKRDFGRCVSLSSPPMNTALKYLRFLAYCPLVTVINERGIVADMITFRRVLTPVQNFASPQYSLTYLFIIFNSVVKYIYSAMLNHMNCVPPVKCASCIVWKSISLCETWHTNPCMDS